MPALTRRRSYNSHHETWHLYFASTVETVQDGRIHIEKINWPMLSEHKATPAEYRAGLDLAIERGLLQLHESGTYVRFTQAGAELWA